MRIRLGIVSSVRHHVDEAHRVVGEVGRRGNPGVDRDEVVLAGELHAVAGVIDHRHRVGTASGDLGGKILHDLDHVVLRQVGRGDHLEAGRIQQLRHRLRIIVGVGELRRVLVFRIADHQRDPLLGTAQQRAEVPTSGLANAVPWAKPSRLPRRPARNQQRFETGHDVLLESRCEIVAETLRSDSRAVRDAGHIRGETASSKITTGIIAAVPLADAIFIIAIIWPMQKWLQSWQPKLAALAITVLVTVASWVVSIYESVRPRTRAQIILLLA